MIDDSAVKFFLITCLFMGAVFGIMYGCQNLIRDPYARCTDYCAGKNDKLTALDKSKVPLECYCYNDVRRNFEMRFKKSTVP